MSWFEQGIFFLKRYLVYRWDCGLFEKVPLSTEWGCGLFEKVPLSTEWDSGCIGKVPEVWCGLEAISFAKSRARIS
jgi:hypothetical protein